MIKQHIAYKIYIKVQKRYKNDTFVFIIGLHMGRVMRSEILERY